ncbi:MAG: hypothetical protein WKF76_11720 [Nocardioidaceae bacterium]
MGQEVERREFTREDRTRYREKVRRCLDVFARMLRESRFDVEKSMTGLEVELNLVDEFCDPAMKNAEALEAIADPDFVTELGQFNLEINVPPRRLPNGGLKAFEDSVRGSLNAAEAKASKVGAHMVMVGVLPTLRMEHMHPDTLSANPRYRLLNDQIFAARGEDLEIAIQGTDRLRVTADSIMPEAACTSMQLHLQVSPDDFPTYWNASQAIAGIQLAVGANSPFLFGKELWAETRIALFEQATDTRSEELKSQGCARGSGSASVGSPRSSTCSRRTCATSQRCCRSPTRRTRWRCWTAAIRRRWRSCVCTTARSTAGTDRSTTWSGGAAPPRGEPGAAGRADRDRHAGERCLLLRSRARPRRRPATAVDSDVVRCGRGELPCGGT